MLMNIFVTQNKKKPGRGLTEVPIRAGMTLHFWVSSHAFYHLATPSHIQLHTFYIIIYTIISNM